MCSNAGNKYFFVTVASTPSVDISEISVQVVLGCIGKEVGAYKKGSWGVYERKLGCIGKEVGVYRKGSWGV
jgi:hypothetical protein